MTGVQFKPGTGKKFSSLPPCPDQCWDLFGFLSSSYHEGFFPWQQSSWGVMLTVHLHPVLRLRMHGATSPLSQHSHIGT